ncbi:MULTISPECIES: hypothetical protein [unclassified Rhodanobacter]|uniref:hypothetical protein n=1 Tax=unclassified Rhodanobacter TaxID=2621553 RepID=UPI001BE0C2B9|nr:MULTISPECIES: hypothetical protein [unclassified Rhodanobacter]MBT2144573.1 hypothetical protein [Rhodanobacter sp. LX-99]MBT2148618.1 hypothetical protein [Rhodanobacter sp. LX-100]
MRALISSFLLATIGITVAQAQSPAADACKSKTVAMLEALQQGDYAATTRDMSAFLRMMSTPDDLQQTREGLIQQYGAWQSHDAAQVAADDKDSVTLRVPLVMAHGKPTAVVICSFKEKAPLGSLAILAPGL